MTGDGLNWNPTPLLSTGKAARGREARTALENARLDFEAHVIRPSGAVECLDCSVSLDLLKKVAETRANLRVAEQGP